MRIVKFWSECPLAGPQFVHPKDAEVLTCFGEGAIDLPALDFKRLIRSDRFGDFQDQRFHLSLLPSPYLGSLRRSDIFILALNPGCHPSDYYAEHCVPEFRKRLGANLHQNLSGVRFPFPALDPALCWWGGFRYWEQKLKDVATVLAKEKHRGHYVKALQELSQRITVLQLVPYHSRSFRNSGIVAELESTKEAIRFAREDLSVRCAADRAIIIVTRQASVWGLPERRGKVILYDKSLARGVPLGPDTPGGKAILERLRNYH